MAEPAESAARLLPEADASPSHLLRAALRSMSEGVVVADPDGSLLLLNDAAAALLGRGVVGASPAEWPQRDRFFLPDGRTPFPAGQLPLMRAVEGESVDGVEICVRMPGRPRRWISGSARPLRGDDGEARGAIAVFRDVTARHLTESLLRAQNAVARILADADSLAAAATPLLQDIAEYLGWDLGELWEIDSWNGVLRPAACWHREDPRLAAVAAAGRRVKYARGESVPGRAWQEGAPVIGVVGPHDGLGRGAAGRRAELQTAIALPLTSGSHALGVLLFWSRETEPSEHELVAALAGLGAQIGQFAARRLSELALRAGEQRMRTFFQRTPYPALVHDEASRRVLAANDAALQAFGFSRDELLELTLDDIRVGPADAASPVARYRRRDGTFVEGEESAQPLEVDGRPAIFVLVRDVTEQRRSEAEMAERLAVSGLGAAVTTSLTWGGTLHRKLQDCAQSLVDHLNLELAGVWRRSATDPTLDVLGAAVRSGTLPASQSRLPVSGHWLGRVADQRAPQWLDLERDAIPAELQWAREAGIRCLGGYPLLQDDRSLGVLALGSVRPLAPAALEALAPLVDEIAVHLEREEVRAALTASEARHRAVLENMLGGLLVVDERAFIETANAEAERIFGYGPGDLTGQHLSLLMALSAGPDYTASLREAFKNAISRITERKGRRRNGEEFPFELAMYEFETTAGKRYGGHIRDLSERHAVEQLKREFVALVSHELRTPLTSIRGSLSLLAGGVLGELPDEAKEVVAIADRNTVRLIHLINDILDLERLEAGRMPMYVSRQPLQGVCDRAVEAVRAMADAQGVRIERLPTGAHVLGDGDRLVQVLVNLLSNAVKFSPEGSTVTVSAHEEPGWVEVRVEDRGRGIPPSHLEAIFERFEQVESSDGRRASGTGLGLPICKAIVEQLGGTMGVNSEVAEGSTFWFRLRSSPPPAKGDELLAALAEGMAGDARDVLLLDEDEALLGVVCRQLLSAAIPVRTARTVRQGLELARARPPSLLMLGLRFPDGDGFEVVRALAADDALRRTPLLVYTSRDLSEDERERLRLGPSRFLTKSQATEQDLLDAVRELRGPGTGA